MRILLVDDNALFLKSAQRFLSSFDAVKAVAIARDGPDALDQLGRQRADMVLMDFSMPGMNGFEATRRIKALDPRIRVIVVSLHDAEEFRTAAASAGAESFVAKRDFAAGLRSLLKADGTDTIAAAGSGPGSEPVRSPG
jgi:DNA-binding NarL/FixJ family response regulator